MDKVKILKFEDFEVRLEYRSNPFKTFNVFGKDTPSVKVYYAGNSKPSLTFSFAFYDDYYFENFTDHIFKFIKNNDSIRDFLKTADSRAYVVGTPDLSDVKNDFNPSDVFTYFYMNTFDFPCFGKERFTGLSKKSVRYYKPAVKAPVTFPSENNKKKKSLFQYLTMLNELSIGVDFSIKSSFIPCENPLVKKASKISSFREDFDVYDENDFLNYLDPVRNPFHEFLRKVPSVNDNIDEFLFLDLAYNDDPKSGTKELFKIVSANRAFINDPEKYKNVKFSDFTQLDNIDDNDACFVNDVFSKLPIINKSFREYLSTLTLEQLNRIICNTTFCRDPETAVYMCDLYKNNEIGKDVLSSKKDLFMTIFEIIDKEALSVEDKISSVSKIKKLFNRDSSLAVYYLLFETLKETKLSKEEIIENIIIVEKIFNNLDDTFEFFKSSLFAFGLNESGKNSSFSRIPSTVSNECVELILLRDAIQKTSAKEVLDGIKNEGLFKSVPGLDVIYGKKYVELYW